MSLKSQNSFCVYIRKQEVYTNVYSLAPTPLLLETVYYWGFLGSTAAVIRITHKGQITGKGVKSNQPYLSNPYTGQLTIPEQSPEVLAVISGDL